ncbi:hypothetical protein [Burkholderia cepacia]|uniref:hypothetical protein n=1 Tax=Burkholderia cepacia TaxID=292 RepID=UPI00264B7ED2|nr:hypothetical protein [Burkholderia cepacia]MDN7611241.1 hypothetical protein [Burkholderia cepacia]
MIDIQNAVGIAVGAALRVATANRYAVTRLKRVMQEVHDEFVARALLLPSTGDVRSEEYEQDGINHARFEMDVKPVEGNAVIICFITGEIPQEKPIPQF